MDISSKTTKHITKRVTLTPLDVLGLIQGEDFAIPPDADIVVKTEVPGGGDWSNMDLIIGEDSDLHVEISWTEEEE